VLLRAGAILMLLWLGRVAVVKSGSLRTDAGEGNGPDGRLVNARGTDRAKPPAITAISPSTLAAGAATTVRISGTRLQGAFVTGSPGIRVTGVQIEADTLLLDVFVDAAAPPGPAALTLVTGGGAVTVPITIALSQVPIMATGDADDRAGAQR